MATLIGVAIYLTIGSLVTRAWWFVDDVWWGHLFVMWFWPFVLIGVACF